jgi:hypothetical protein
MSFQMLWREDPGHAWLQVPLAEVKRSKAKISAYSYKKGDLAFLEEDCDVFTFLKAISPNDDQAIKLSRSVPRVYEENTPIRNYRCYC